MPLYAPVKSIAGNLVVGRQQSSNNLGTFRSNHTPKRVWNPRIPFNRDAYAILTHFHPLCEGLLSVFQPQTPWARSNHLVANFEDDENVNTLGRNRTVKRGTYVQGGRPKVVVLCGGCFPHAREAKVSWTSNVSNSVRDPWSLQLLILLHVALSSCLCAFWS